MVGQRPHRSNAPVVLGSTVVSSALLCNFGRTTNFQSSGRNRLLVSYTTPHKYKKNTRPNKLMGCANPSHTFNLLVGSTFCSASVRQYLPPLFSRSQPLKRRGKVAISNPRSLFSLTGLDPTSLFTNCSLTQHSAPLGHCPGVHNLQLGWPPQGSHRPA